MTDTQLLKRYLAVNGISITELAEKLNMGRCTLSRKVNNRSEFRSDEIMKISEILMIYDKDPVFFANE